MVTASRCWVTHRGVPRATVDGQPTRALLDLYQKKKTTTQCQLPQWRAFVSSQLLLLSQF